MNEPQNFEHQTFEHQDDPALYPAILEALESKPHPAIPADFAARMARLAQAQPIQRPRTRTHYGQTAAWFCLAILTVAVVALAPSTITANATLTPLATIEYTLIAQLLALALWLGTRTFPGTR